MYLRLSPIIGPHSRCIPLTNNTLPSVLHRSSLAIFVLQQTLIVVTPRSSTLIIITLYNSPNHQWSLLLKNNHHHGPEPISLFNLDVLHKIIWSPVSSTYKLPYQHYLQLISRHYQWPPLSAIIFSDYKINNYDHCPPRTTPRQESKTITLGSLEKTISSNNFWKR